MVESSSYVLALNNKWEKWSMSHEYRDYGVMRIEGHHDKSYGEHDSRVVIYTFDSVEHINTWFTPDEVDELILALIYAQAVARGEIND